MVLALQGVPTELPALLCRASCVFRAQETSDVAGVMDGDLQPFMQAYLKHRGRQQGAAAAEAAAAAAGLPAAGAAT